MKTSTTFCNSLLMLIALFVLSASFSFAHSTLADDRPNILFIMSDDHGYQAIGAYGSVVNKTPNIDRIASGGMRFDRCFVTNSICGPCRATILTGKYSHLNGFACNGDKFNGEQQHVAKLLKGAGYQTAVIGKWHLATEPTGFDYFHVLKGQGPYYNPPMLSSNGPVNHTGYTTDIITDLTLDWLKTKRDDSKPFYLMYQHKAPHRNWQPGPKYLNKYDSVTIPEPETLYDDYEGRTSAAKSQAMTVENHLSPHDLKLSKQKNRMTPEQREAWDAAYGPKNEEFEKANLKGKELIQWKYQRYAKDYLRCVDSVDENVGRVLDYLEETGLDKNTIVIYTSDQGWYLGEHGWYDKRWMYEESFRTPLLVRWPGKIKPGTSSETMVMNLDFAETFLEIAGAPIPDDMQGRSMVPVLKGETPGDWRKSVYYHYYEFPGAHSVQKHYGVRTEAHKLIHFYERDEWELFDLEKDPNELKSVYDNAGYEKVRKELETELSRLREKYDDDGSVVEFEGYPRNKRARDRLKRKRGKEKKQDAEPKTGMRKLFNGTDLTGWDKMTKSYFEEAGEVRVVDGEIEIGKGKPGSGIVIAGKNKKNMPRINYRVEFDAKRTDGGDFFCGLTFPVKDDYLTLILGGWGGTAVGLSNIDNMSAIDNETSEFVDFESNKWYHVKHEVTDGKVETWIDDEKIISVETADKELDIWWEMEPGRPLGIATWNTEARYRNITLTKIATETEEATVEE